MKQIIILLSILIFISCQEQRETYLIKGNVKGIPDSTIINLYIQNGNLLKVVGTDTIMNGYFEFSDTLENRPSKMNLRIQDWNNYSGGCNLWVDHEVIDITGTGKYLSAWTASGNNDELKAMNRLNEHTRDLSVSVDSLYLLRTKNIQDRELSKRIINSVDSIEQISHKIQFPLIEEDPNSLSALELLYNIARMDTSISKRNIKMVYDNLDSIYQNTLYGEGILTIIENKPVPEVGDTMVDFAAYDTEGNKHQLNDYKGKYILLDFWSLGCGPCIRAIPETRALSTNNKDILTIVGVNMTTDEDLWREKSKKDSITWVNLSDGKGIYAGASTDYGITGFPTYILIDPQGVIVEKWMGYRPDFLKQKLESHIQDLKI